LIVFKVASGFAFDVGGVRSEEVNKYTQSSQAPEPEKLIRRISLKCRDFRPSDKFKDRETLRVQQLDVLLPEPTSCGYRTLNGFESNLNV
jgi:hypothetical protein